MVRTIRSCYEEITRNANNEAVDINVSPVCRWKDNKLDIWIKAVREDLNLEKIDGL